MAEIEIEQISNDEWGRRLSDDDQDVFGVSVSLNRGVGDAPFWSVLVAPMEFCRTDPLESELAQALTLALAAVPRVSRAIEEDREIWLVEGDPSGPDLVRAASLVVDSFRDRIENELDLL